MCAAILQHGDDHKAWCFTHVVSVRLKSDAEYCNCLIAQIASDRLRNTPRHGDFALDIHFFDLLYEREWSFCFTRGADQSRYILWKAGSAIAWSRMQKF